MVTKVEKKIEKRIFPSLSHPTQEWPLSVSDLVMPSVNVRWLAFYEHNGNPDFMDIDALEASLAKMLDLYPLLAARLVPLPLGRFQIEYKQDDLQGCSFTIATANFTLETLRKTNFSRNDIPPELQPGSPIATLSTPLFSVQHTQLACGSVAMSYAMHHKIGDGYSMHSFVEKWARLCRGLTVEAPLLNRFALAPNSDPLVSDHAEYKIITPRPPGPTVQVPPESVRIKVTITKDKLALLKRAANTGLAPGQWVSTNDAVVTLIWRAATRARGLEEGEITTCGIAVDGRKRWETPLGDMTQYFGNFIAVPAPKSSALTLLQTPMGEACLLLRSAVTTMDRTRIQSCLNWMDRVNDKSFIQPNFNCYGGPDIFITSWLSFPMYECDFKWGQAHKVVSRIPGMDGIAFILPCGPSVDNNGVEVLFGALLSNSEKILHDNELALYGTVVID